MSDHRASSGRKIRLAVGAGVLALVTFGGGYAAGNAGHSSNGSAIPAQSGQRPGGTAGQAPPSAATGTVEGPILDS
ncbi:MAG: hypothetical protein JWR83_160 [Aeromicrobium sp.]|nr:hypothetical protein [Aeromicrobium sp.]